MMGLWVEEVRRLYNNQVIVVWNVTPYSLVSICQLHDVPSTNIHSRGKRRYHVLKIICGFSPQANYADRATAACFRS
jgi:hypothetical protein